MEDNTGGVIFHPWWWVKVGLLFSVEFNLILTLRGTWIVQVTTVKSSVWPTSNRQHFQS